MNLSIAQFTFGLHAGGQERVVADLATAFHSRGHKSLVCSVMFEGQLADELESINRGLKDFEEGKIHSNETARKLYEKYYLKDLTKTCPIAKQRKKLK